MNNFSGPTLRLQKRQTLHINVKKDTPNLLDLECLNHSVPDLSVGQIRTTPNRKLFQVKEIYFCRKYFFLALCLRPSGISSESKVRGLSRGWRCSELLGLRSGWLGLKGEVLRDGHADREPGGGGGLLLGCLRLPWRGRLRSDDLLLGLWIGALLWPDLHWKLLKVLEEGNILGSFYGRGWSGRLRGRRGYLTTRWVRVLSGE